MGILDERGALLGKVAAVIGGGDGIGRAISLGLARSGVDLAICDIDQNALEATRAEVRGLGQKALAIAGDATDRGTLSSFYAALAKEHERLDIVVNVVGGVRRRRFADSTDEECEQDIRRNYGYIVDSIRYALPLIQRGGAGGSIINFTTIEAHRGAAGFSVYAGAKAATMNFTRSLAVELGPQRIRVNALAPDTTPSPGNTKTLEPEMLQRLGALPEGARGIGMDMYVPLKECPPVDDVANGVLFLASDLSRSITGTTLHVDGGTWAASGFMDWPFGDGPCPAPLAGTVEKLYGRS